MTREYGLAAEERFRAFLRHAGYADDMIVRNYRIGRREVDFAVVDPASGQPLLLFEVKMGAKEQAIALAAAQLKQVRRALDPLHVRTFAVRIIPEMGGVQVYEVGAGEPVLVTDEVGRAEAAIPPSTSADKIRAVQLQPMPTIAEARSEAVSRTVSRYIAKLRSATDAFSLFSGLLAAVIAVLFAADITGWLQLDARQLSLLGAFVVLVLAPFSSKLKILGIEFERFQRTTKPSERVPETENPPRLLRGDA